MDWGLDNCEVSGGVENCVDEARDVWFDTFMRRMAAY